MKIFELERFRFLENGGDFDSSCFSNDGIDLNKKGVGILNSKFQSVAWILFLFCCMSSMCQELYMYI